MIVLFLESWHLEPFCSPLRWFCWKLVSFSRRSRLYLSTDLFIPSGTGSFEQRKVWFEEGKRMTNLRVRGVYAYRRASTRQAMRTRIAPTNTSHNSRHRNRPRVLGTFFANNGTSGSWSSMPFCKTQLMDPGLSLRHRLCEVNCKEHHELVVV